MIAVIWICCGLATVLLDLVVFPLFLPHILYRDYRDYSMTLAGLDFLAMALPALTGVVLTRRVIRKRRAAVEEEQRIESEKAERSKYNL